MARTDTHMAKIEATIQHQGVAIKNFGATYNSYEWKA